MPTSSREHVTKRLTKEPVSQHKPVIGLIGGMGSGKSTLAAELARRGARVLSGDQFGHDALRQAAIRDQVVARWGAEVLDEGGEINRRALAARVFASVEERTALEQISFPWIERRFREEIDAARNDPLVALIVLDAAILLEAGWDKLCDWIVCIQAPREERLKRLAAQRQWTPADVAAREAAQLPLADKVARADVVLDNTGSPEQLSRQAEAVLALVNRTSPLTVTRQQQIITVTRGALEV